MEIKSLTKKRLFLIQYLFVWLAFFLTVAISISVTNVIQMKNLANEADGMLSATQAAILASIHDARSTLETAAVYTEGMLKAGIDEETIEKYLRMNNIHGSFRTYGMDIMGVSGDIISSAPHMNPDTGSYTITLTKPVIGADGEYCCLISKDIPIEEFKDIVLDISSTDGGFGMLADENFTLFIHPRDDFLGKKMADINVYFEDLAEGFKGANNVFHKSMRNFRNEYSVIYVLKMENGWYLGFLTPYFNYYSDVFLMAGVLAFVGILFALSLSLILARINKNAESQQKLLNVLNRSSVILLSVKVTEDFLSSINECLSLIGSELDTDRVMLFRNEKVDGRMQLSYKYGWFSDYCKNNSSELSAGWSLPYSSVHEWEDAIRNREDINEVIRNLPYERFTFIHELDVRSVAVIPLFIHDELWGVFTADNCRKEKPFTKNEMTMLKSSGLMLVNTVERYGILNKVRAQAHWYESLLDALPYPLSAQDLNMKFTFMNAPYERLFGRNREKDMGVYCGENKTVICNTENCAIELAKKGQFQTIGHFKDLTHQIDTKIIYDMSGKEIGYIELIQDITDKEILLRKKVEAESANRAKSMFLSTVSHEIRTPMNAIIGIADINLRKKTLTPEIRNALEIIYSSGHILLGIINELLDLSKIEAGKMVITPEKYDTIKLINDIVQINIVLIGSKPIEFNLSVDPTLPAELIGDGLRVEQVLNNVLSNAFKYTLKGRVSLSVETENQRNGEITVVYKVADTGAGMSPEQLKTLFNEYSQFNNKANRTVEGVGLGMSIAKKLVDLMRGDIKIKSEQNYGTLFTIRLPQKLCGADEIGMEASENLRMLKFLNLKPKRTQIAYKMMDNKTCLIVDDNETNLLVTDGLLAPYQIKSEYCDSGVNAVDKIKAGKTYDIILMDHMMPVMDGIEATEIIRSLGYTKPIVALTANAMTGIGETFIARGFDDYIPKPIDTRHLDNVLKKLVGTGSVDAVPIPAPYEHEKPNPELVAALIRDVKKAIAALNTALFNEKFKGDFKSYITTIHGVKSVLSNAGYASLSEAAFKLETAAGENNSEVLMKEIPGFIDRLEELIESISDYGS